MYLVFFFFFFKQKTAYEMRISDWSSDVCSSDLGCPAFFARSVRGVKNGPSPEWLQKRLKAIGQKPISTLVDITNFIMIDLGRPLHVYDMATLKGGLVARKARAGEEVLALRSEEHTSELQSLMRISYAVFCLKKKKIRKTNYNKKR